jgi:TetR/AcrR family transcriptional repressor of nem operon
MRYPAHHKRHTRERIVAAASHGFREHGIAGLGVAAVMAELGLTHGGFYAHFPDKDALVAAACRRALSDAWASLDDYAGLAPDAVVRALSRSYLADANRRRRGEGCPVAALGGELARSAPPVRRAVAREVTARLARLAPLMPGRTPRRRQDAATLLVSTMVGALVLSRLLPDREGRRSLDVARRLIGHAADAAQSAAADRRTRPTTRPSPHRARQERARS